MDTKTIVPFVGVVIGWLLNEASRLVRGRAEDRKLINRVISKLMALRFQACQVISLTRSAIDIHGYSENTENERQRLMQKHIFDTDDLGGSITEIIREVSSYDPILATKTSNQIKSIQKFIEIKLDITSKIPSQYEKTINNILITVEVAVIVLEKIILELALKNSFVLWIRLKLYFRKGLEGEVPLEVGKKVRAQLDSIIKELDSNTPT